MQIANFANANANIINFASHKIFLHMQEPIL